MISEGSCDTEEWSNNDENSALITGINYTLLYIHTESCYFKLKIFNINFCIFDQIINAALRYIFLKNSKSHWPLTFERWYKCSF